MDPIFITFAGFEVRWYSVLALLAILIGIGIGLREGKRFKINNDFLFNLAFWAIVFGFFGARLYYVLFNFHLYENNLIDILKIWEGGLAIHGGLLFGLITIFIYTKKYNVNTMKIIDLIVPSVILGQAIGRWGNFFNSEAFGPATTIERLQYFNIPEFVINGMLINGVYYHPTFLYESLWCFIGFVALLVIRRIKYIKIGVMTSFYMIWYSVGRFYIESLRTDSLMIGGFKAAQCASILMIVVAIVILIIQGKKTKFEDLYNQEEEVVRF